ncbi:MAG: GGDEF domain-containing response regulator, partial [Calditrichaeota bacterium]
MNGEIRILLVEDSAGDARLFQEHLRDASDLHTSLLHVQTFSAASETLKQQEFDVVFLDLSLPDSTGLRTFERLRRVAPETPIILLTGRDDEEFAVKAVKRGAQDYLVKGQVDSTLLVRAMRYAIERQHLMVEMAKTRELEKHLAYHDSLTDLPNRQLFFDRLRQALANARRYNRQLAILFLDLDGFKEVNDTHGHTVGDALLKILASKLKSCIRESDTVARIGGDEFILFLNGIKRSEDAVTVAKKLIARLSEPVRLENLLLPVSTSIGISLYPQDGEDILTLVKRADAAMYQAKRKGNGSYQLFTRLFASDRAGCSGAGREVTIEQPTLYYQPQACIQSGRVVALDAVPMSSADQQNGSSGGEPRFLDETGRWLLTTIGSQSRSWCAAGLHPIPISVKLTLQEVENEDYLELLEQVSHQLGDGRELLRVALRESEVMQNIDLATTLLRSMKKRGVGISLDDFGAGYSSLSQLKRLPVDMLTVDATFVAGVPEDPDATAIVSAIVAMAHSLGIKVTAKGVSNPQQFQVLQSVRCDVLQG